MSVTARSYLFVPGHKRRMLTKAFTLGADEVIVDLEDAVPAQDKDAARTAAREVLSGHRAWVRINAVRSAVAEADLAAIAGLAHGIRIPKVESVQDVSWVADRVPGEHQFMCAIETARGILAAPPSPRRRVSLRLAMGGLDLRADLQMRRGTRSFAVQPQRVGVASRANGLDAPVDSVYPHASDLGRPRSGSTSRS